MTPSAESAPTLPVGYEHPGSKYRLRAQADERGSEGLRLGQSDIPPADNPGRIGKLSGLSRIWSYVGWEAAFTISAALLFLLSAALVAEGSSVTARGQFALLALIPLSAIVLILGWLDRWASLALKYKVLGIAWGGGVAAILAMIINSAIFSDLLNYGGDEQQATITGAIFIAPVSEELVKGIGVVLILLMVRNRLSSLLSAVALGGLVGAGFAYIENLDYFWQAWQEGTVAFGATLVARGILSPFIHPMATSFIGLAAGSAVLSRARASGWFWRLILGFGAAILIHGVWNGLATVGAAWFLWYLLLEIPLFVAWLTALIVWSARISGSVASGLLPYVQSGWLTENDVSMVTVPVARKQAKGWAKRLGKPAPSLLKALQQTLGRLGLNQTLMTDNGVTEERAGNSRADLEKALRLRDELVLLENMRGAA